MSAERWSRAPRSHGRGLGGERDFVTNGTTPWEVASGGIAQAARGRARRPGRRASVKEHELSWRWRARRRAGAVEHAGDGVGGVDDLEDAHPAAARATDGDVDGEHAGEEAGPADAARGLGLRPAFRLVAAGEVERELLAGELGAWARDDARAEVMVAGEDAEVADHVEVRRRDEVVAALGAAGVLMPRGQERHTRATPHARRRREKLPGLDEVAQTWGTGPSPAGT